MDFWSARKIAERELRKIGKIPLKDMSHPFWEYVDVAIQAALKNCGKEEFLEKTTVFFLDPMNTIDFAIAYRLRKRRATDV